MFDDTKSLMTAAPLITELAAAMQADAGGKVRMTSLEFGLKGFAKEFGLPYTSHRDPTQRTRLGTAVVPLHRAADLLADYTQGYHEASLLGGRGLQGTSLSISLVTDQHDLLLPYLDGPVLGITARIGNVIQARYWPRSLADRPAYEQAMADILAVLPPDAAIAHEGSGIDESHRGRASRETRH